MRGLADYMDHSATTHYQIYECYRHVGHQFESRVQRILIEKVSQDRFDILTFRSLKHAFQCFVPPLVSFERNYLR
jgi:hypothetical protein